VLRFTLPQIDMNEAHANDEKQRRRLFFVAPVSAAVSRAWLVFLDRHLLLTATRQALLRFSPTSAFVCLLVWTAKILRACAVFVFFSTISSLKINCEVTVTSRQSGGYMLFTRNIPVRKFIILF